MVLTCCNQILFNNNSNVKAFYRRGIANMKLNNYEEALSDL
jgi:hypothetical protein